MKPFSFWKLVSKVCLKTTKHFFQNNNVMFNDDYISGLDIILVPKEWLSTTYSRLNAANTCVNTQIYFLRNPPFHSKKMFLIFDFFSHPDDNICSLKMNTIENEKLKTNILFFDLGCICTGQFFNPPNVLEPPISHQKDTFVSFVFFTSVRQYMFIKSKYEQKRKLEDKIIVPWIGLHLYSPIS